MAFLNFSFSKVQLYLSLIIREKLMPNKLGTFMSAHQANKFVKDTLQIKIDSIVQYTPA